MAPAVFADAVAPFSDFERASIRPSPAAIFGPAYDCLFTQDFCSLTCKTVRGTKGKRVDLRRDPGKH